jgi:hypothetical protein
LATTPSWYRDVANDDAVSQYPWFYLLHEVPVASQEVSRRIGKPVNNPALPPQR